MQKPQIPVSEPGRLLDVVAVAELLDVSPRHVYRLADGGRMPRPVKLGGSVRWPRQLILDWIASPEYCFVCAIVLLHK